MAIERMKLLSITGKEENIDRFIVKYLLDSGLQTENAIKVFEKGWRLTNFKYDSTPKDLQKKCKNLLDAYGIRYKEDYKKEKIKKRISEISQNLDEIKSEYDNIQNLIKEKNDLLHKSEEYKKILDNTKNLDIEVDIKELYNLEYMKFRYGKISKENYDRLERNLRDLDAFIEKVAEKDNEIWLICFTTKESGPKVDSYLNLFKFERVWIPEELNGTPKEMLVKIENEINNLNQEIDDLSQELVKQKNKNTDDLLNNLAELNLYIKINSVKKYMAHDENGLFYIIGWIPNKELKQLIPKLSNEKDIKFIIKSHDEVASTPPTKLKNLKIFKPFETLVKMYGLPNYNELDPTVFVGITAFLLFGFMFGDVGHGLVIFLIGLIMAKKKVELGPVFEAGGIASMIFGCMYGSIFGKEIIPALFIRPMENIETMLIYGIAFGVILIISAMILNIRNGIKSKDKERVFFDTNGLSGLLFYIIVLTSAVYFFMKGKLYLSIGILSLFIIITLLAVMFKDKLAKIIFKKEPEENPSFVERIFEMIEALLSFASNTISFVRIAAFAINHVGLCMAVYILSGMASGAGNFAITLIGNLIVIVLEGLIVAIQVLRLEYYELFSRFYSGNGKEYVPLKEKI